MNYRAVENMKARLSEEATSLFVGKGYKGTRVQDMNDAAQVKKVLSTGISKLRMPYRIRLSTKMRGYRWTT